MEINFDVVDGNSTQLNASPPKTVPFGYTADPDHTLTLSEDDPIAFETSDENVDFEIEENIRSGGSSNYEDLSNKPSINGVTLIGNKTTSDLGIVFEEVDPTVPAWAKQESKPDYTASEVGAFPLTDLGAFSIVEYDWDFWAFLEDKVESGFFKITDVDDGFGYFFRIERTDNQVYQEWWYEEESALYRNVRVGWFVDDEWDWSDTTYWVTDEQLYSNFYGKWQTYNKQEVNNLLADKVNTDTLEDNYYTSDQVDDLLDGFAPSTMVETTWAALRNLRDSNQLVKGAWYRIVDYNFVTTKLGVQSGNHQFDIVLLAISESMLSESGYACKHSGDHYFEREITEGGVEWLYTLYVDYMSDDYGDEPFDHQDDLHASDAFCDADVMPHPETGDDVPVLFKTDTGEYDIDDPDYDDAYFYEGTYDLDGDEYDMWAKYEYSSDDEEWIFMHQYALTPIVVEDGELIVSPIPETKIVPVNMNAWELKYCLDNDKDLFDWAETDGKGVIYWLKDEFGNEAPYDFKNVMFRRYQVSAVSNTVLNSLRNLYLYEDGYYALTRNNNSKYLYTFTNIAGDGDGSLFGECTYNVIMPFIYLSPKGKNIRGINDVVLQNANRNTLQHNCRNITILYSATDNILSGCFNICGTSYSRCLIGINSSSVTFYLLQNANFDNCRQIIGQQADAPKIGSGCYLINLGNSSVGTVMGTSCNNITLGQWCYNITIGYSVGNITFGNYCSYLTIGSYCNYITMTSYHRYCTIEDNVTRFDFATTGGNTSNYVQYVKVCQGVTNKSITPARKMSYEQIYYAAGRTETAL